MAISALLIAATETKQQAVFELACLPPAASACVEFSTTWGFMGILSKTMVQTRMVGDDIKGLRKKIDTMFSKDGIVPKPHTKEETKQLKTPLVQTVLGEAETGYAVSCLCGMCAPVEMRFRGRCLVDKALVRNEYLEKVEQTTKIE